MNIVYVFFLQRENVSEILESLHRYIKLVITFQGLSNMDKINQHNSIRLFIWAAEDHRVYPIMDIRWSNSQCTFDTCDTLYYSREFKSFSSNVMCDTEGISATSTSLCC